MWSINRLLYSLVDPLFYEPISRYQPDVHSYLEPVRELLPTNWRVTRTSLWFTCLPVGSELPPQGWKIHVSATIRNATELLKAIVPILTRERVGFKFAADPTILRLLLSKQWPRGSAGKFVTIYPGSQGQFLSLIEEIHLATVSEAGPYILSDKRYKTSRCVFYRYGSFIPRTFLRVNGESTHYLLSVKGERVPDVRQAWFVVPDGINDPFPQPDSPPTPKGLKGGRYDVTGSLRFSNSGGVYLAVDNDSGAQVVIKEARPLVNLEGSGEDALSFLRKEYRLLRKIEITRIAPRPIDFFEEWEHCFLVEEFLQGLTLRTHAATHTFALLTDPSVEKVRELFEAFRGVFLSLIEAISVLHRNGIVFRDLSPRNVMILGTGEIRLLDFEAACENGVDSVTTLFTPGFAAADQFAGEFARFENDYFALGALMLSYLMPVHGLIGLDPAALERFAKSVADDYGLPESLRSTVLGLLNPAPSARPTSADVLTELRGEARFRRMRISEPTSFDEREYRRFVENLTDYILRTATYEREDRLFPSDPKVFVTNALSLAYGACGVAYAIKRITGELPNRVSDWIFKHEIEPDSYPPGMYIGMAGIAWALLELGFEDRAEQILLASSSHSLLFETADVFYGLAGWGMANLKFFISLKKQTYLDKAVQAGEFIIRNRLETAEGDYWNSWNSGEGWIGFAHGSSGIALFLLYLYLATRELRFLQVGERALRFDLSRAQPLGPGRGLSWPIHKGVGSSVVPYWRYGSAGVGTVLLRFLNISNDSTFRSFLSHAFSDAARKYTIFPGKFFGLAGLGDFLLDLADFEVDSGKYLEHAKRVASGIRLFAVNPSGRGPAFPGSDLWKISCDYGSGGAGIALFLNRLIAGRKCDFMLDELISGALLQEVAHQPADRELNARSAKAAHNAP